MNDMLENSLIQYQTLYKEQVKKIVIFRDGFNISKFIETEEQFCIEWGKEKEIAVENILCIKGNAFRMTEIDKSKYFPRCFVKLSDKIIAASTSERANKGSRPIVYYSRFGYENLLNYVTEICSLHFYFKDTKLPEVIRLVDD